MDVKQLQCFLAAADELNFSRAAARLHMTQPPLSRQIAQLEASLGVRLFERSPQSVALTAAGRALAPEARKVLAALGELREVARRADQGQVGRIRIGFVGSTIYTSVPALVGQYRRLYPEVSVDLQQLTVSRQTDLLLSGDIDLGIIRQAISHPRLATRRLAREPFVAALPADHRLAAQSFVALKSLAGEAMVAFSREEAPAIHEQMRRMCEAAGFSPRIVQEAHPMSTVVGLVGAGAGVAIVPQSMESLAFQNVAYRPLRGTRETSEFFVAWRRGDATPTVQNFLRVARTQETARAG